MSYTHGPWIAGGAGVVRLPDGLVSRTVHITMREDRLGQAVDDMHLIEAAPDLLAALEQVVDVLEGMHDCGECWTCDDVLPQARAAIAKARWVGVVRS